MRALLLRLSFACCLSGLAFAGRAQTATSPAPADFAAEPFVILNYSAIYSYKADGTGSWVESGAVRIQADNALRDFGVLSVQYASLSEHAEFVYARVRHADGSMLETPVTDALEQPAPVTREAPFYSDIKIKQLPIKSLHVGDTLEWQWRITRTVPEAPNQFWGQKTFIDEGVVLDDTLELHVPAAVHVNVWVNPRDSSPAQESTANGEHIYVFHHSHLKPTVGAAAEAARKAQEAHILTPEEEFDATHGKLPSVAWTTFADWAAVGDWYRKLETSRAVPDDTIKARVAELIAGKTTDQEKAEAIYNYVALQIRYVGVAFGIGRYQPHLASEVLANQYGDCKDKHTLLAAMLSAAGISSDAALIGADIRFNEAVPSPAAFNHLITRAHIGGHDVWLDSTAEVAPFAMLVTTIRDKQALVIPDDSPALIARTPEKLPFDSFTKATVQGALDKDLTSESHIALTFRGDVELALRAIIRQASAAQYSEFFQQMMGSMGFGGTTSDPDIQNLQDTTKPLVLAFHYHRVKNEDWGTNRVTVIFIPIELPFVDEKKPPTSSLELGPPRVETSSVEMKLPEHWGVELPEVAHAKADFATCDVTYHVTAGTFHAERRLEVLKKSVAQKDWKAYKTWYDACGASGVPYLQLIPAATSANSTASDPVVTVSNDQAAKLIQQADSAIRARDTDKGLALLDQAKALNPQQRNLWGMYGFRAYQLGLTSEAIEDYRKETVFHPDNAWAYAPLAEELDRTGKKDEAIAAIRKGVSIEPDNERLNAMLVSLLDNQGDTKAAIEAGNAALKLIPPDNPKNSVFILALATAQIKAGDKAAAAQNLVPLLKVATDPGTQNNIVYMLADMDLELPAAEAAERSALDTFTSLSSSWTLEENAASLKQKSTLLAASWDTMGWIYFREGRIKDAYSYVSASWHVNHHAEVGLHLGDLAMAENDPNTAFNAYELALATQPVTRGPVPPSIAAMNEKIKAGIDRARKAGGKSSVKDWHAAAQALRVIPLGPSEGRVGSAEYRILISQGKVDSIRAVGNGLPKGDTLLLSTNFSEFTPSGEKGRVLISGYLNCLTTTCELVIEP